MAIPNIRTNYGMGTPLDPDGVNIWRDNQRVLYNIERGHLETNNYMHASNNIFIDSMETLYDKLLYIQSIIKQYDSEAATLLSKANKLKEDAHDLYNKALTKTDTTVGGKSGSIEIKGIEDIIVGTAPADNIITINNTQVPEYEISSGS